MKALIAIIFCCAVVLTGIAALKIGNAQSAQIETKFAPQTKVFTFEKLIDDKGRRAHARHAIPVIDPKKIQLFATTTK